MTVEVLNELEAAARALDKASDQLARTTERFEGWYGEVKKVDPQTGEVVITRGQWQPGPQLRWRVAVSEAMEAVVTEKYAEGRVPAAERLERMGELRVMKEQPDLYADYHRMQTEINALQKWISARKQSISARQSVLGAEKALAGVPRG